MNSEMAYYYGVFSFFSGTRGEVKAVDQPLVELFLMCSIISKVLKEKYV